MNIANLPCPHCEKMIAMPLDWVEGMRMNCPSCGEEITEDYVRSAQEKVQGLEAKALENWKRRKGRY